MIINLIKPTKETHNKNHYTVRYTSCDLKYILHYIYSRAKGPTVPIAKHVIAYSNRTNLPITIKEEIKE